MPPENQPSASSVPEQPFKFHDLRQEQIYDRLRSLVGPGIGEFYKDACRHMEMQPPFTTTTHLVSHLLREIESAVRGVLKSLTGPVERSSDQHMSEIKTILKALDFSDTDPISIAWLTLPGDHGLQDRAHRNNLDAPRPLDPEFLEFWARMQTILESVLDRFESKYTKVFNTIDSLAHKNKPTSDDVKLLLQNIPNNLVTRQRFFNELAASGEWLEALRNKDVFKVAPGVEHFPDGGYRFLSWPELVFLKKMASIEPETVSEILTQVKTNGNGGVQGQLLEIATELPRQTRALVLLKAKEWMDGPGQLFITREAQNLIMKYVDEDDPDAALDLCATFLEILPDPKAATPPTDPVHGAPYDPKSRIDDWQYSEFLKKDFGRIAEARPWEALELLSRLLSDFMEFDNAHADHQFRDGSYITRPAIEDHEQNHLRDGVAHALISGVRDVAMGIVKKNEASLNQVVSALEAKRWTIFRRIVLVLLSQYPTADPELIARYATDKSLFEDHEIMHEYAVFLRNVFPHLSAGQQATILDWIEKAEEIDERVTAAKPTPSDEQAERFKKNWQRNKLSFIAEHLTGPWKTRYDSLVAEVGKPDHADFTSYSTTFVGPVSEISAHSLSEMVPDALIEYLKSWQPKKEDRFSFGPTREGLGRDLSGAVVLKPAHFEAIAERFKGLDPTYVRSYLQGFHDIDITNWDGILSLSEWVMTQPREIPGRSGGVMEQDTDWGWTKRTIASALLRGMQKNLIPFELRERVWRLIEWVTEDPDPTPEEDAKRAKNYADDPYTYTINTVRGEAMEAAVQYALWVYRELGRTEEGKKLLGGGFDAMPEVRDVLNKHLDSDSSAAIRAVYGRYLPWLQLMDKNWLMQRLEQIMPSGRFGDALYLAAWTAFIMHTPAFDDVLPTMRSRFQEAIGHLADGGIENREDRNTRLIEQLMVHYMRGRIPLDDAILTAFYAKASPDLRGYALDYIGRNLASRANAEHAFPVDTMERLQELWGRRADAAESATDKTTYQPEMEAFGWWFASGKFPEKWSADQYLRALEIAGNKTQIDHLVADRLVASVVTLPVETIAILRKIVLTERPAWILLGNKDDVRMVLSQALNSPIEGARAAAEDLVNRLTAHGFPEFRDLLQRDTE